MADSKEMNEDWFVFGGPRTEILRARDLLYAQAAEDGVYYHMRHDLYDGPPCAQTPDKEHALNRLDTMKFMFPCFEEWVILGDFLVRREHIVRMAIAGGHKAIAAEARVPGAESTLIRGKYKSVDSTDGAHKALADLCARDPDTSTDIYRLIKRNYFARAGRAPVREAPSSPVNFMNFKRKRTEE